MGWLSAINVLVGNILFYFEKLLCLIVISHYYIVIHHNYVLGIMKRIKSTFFESQSWKIFKELLELLNIASLKVHFNQRSAQLMIKSEGLLKKYDYLLLKIDME